MKKSANPSVFLGLCLATLLVGGAGLFFQYSKLNNVKQEVTALRSQVKDESVVQQELEGSKTKLAEYSEDLAHLEQSVPEFAYIPTMMSELEQIGNEMGIKVTGVRPAPKEAKSSGDGEKTESSSYEEFDIEIKGRGTYDAAERFVNAMKEFPKIVAARTVSLDPKRAMNNELSRDLDITIVLKAYVFPPVKSAATEEEDLTETDGSEGSQADEVTEEAPAETAPPSINQAAKESPEGGLVTNG